ncbi:MAG TPA: 2OG-Fe(II) oxygenase [Blastocatellia bacterium]|nr:2OG-Fe(II) oxygenase [Blastocatellia bacterium]
MIWRKQTSSKIFVFKSADLADLADRHCDAYQAASPYPHAVIDGFLSEPVANQVLSAFPKPDADIWLDWRKRDIEHQPLKQGIGHAERLELADPFLHQVILAFNSYPLINFLEILTGIKGLIPDPHLSGGGLHQILTGGKLAVHADFNYLERLGLYRRINLLLYLNKNWKDEYGGHLEMWDKQMQRCVKRVLPAFNRCVVFNTSATSYHGHPEPLACPQGVTRKSLAFYYYTQTSGEDAERHETLWQKRPSGS